MNEYTLSCSGRHRLFMNIIIIGCILTASNSNQSLHGGISNVIRSNIRIIAFNIAFQLFITFTSILRSHIFTHSNSSSHLYSAPTSSHILILHHIYIPLPHHHTFLFFIISILRSHIITRSNSSSHLYSAPTSSHILVLHHIYTPLPHHHTF